MNVIAIDFDGTASKCPEKVNKLFECKENFIVIYTARSENIRQQTVKELADLDIKYHALVMQKMRASIYIDDKNGGFKDVNNCK